MNETNWRKILLAKKKWILRPALKYIYNLKKFDLHFETHCSLSGLITSSFLSKIFFFNFLNAIFVLQYVTNFIWIRSKFSIYNI